MAEEVKTGKVEKLDTNTGLVPLEIEKAKQRTMGEIEAKILLARRFQRDVGSIKKDAIDLCKDPSFAERSYYTLFRETSVPPDKAVAWAKEHKGDPDFTIIDGKPDGKVWLKVRVRIQGAGIRLMEYLASQWTNLDTKRELVSEDSEKQVYRIRIWDMQTNSSQEADVVVGKVVFRKNRDNKMLAGAELQQAANSLISRVERNLLKKMIRQDVTAECFIAAQNTMFEENKKPDAVRKMLVAFEKVGVTEEQVRAKCGLKEGETFTADQVTDMRGLYRAIRDEESTIEEAFSAEPQTETEKPEPEGFKGAATVEPDGKKEAGKTKDEIDEALKGPQPYEKSLALRTYMAGAYGVDVKHVIDLIEGHLKERNLGTWKGLTDDARRTILLVVVDDLKAESHAS